MEQREITGSTRLYCLLGSPVAHSVSPQMHNLAFQRLGLDCRYLAFDVTLETLEAAVAGLRALGAGGWNLTMPLKTAMVPLCDELSLTAQLCGAVNTVVNREGKLLGDSTDGLGWVLSARAAGQEVRGRRLTLLGLGGAGSSVLAQCALEGAAGIDVWKRRNGTWEEALAFARRVSQRTDCPIRVLDLEEEKTLRESLERTELLINATPVGMSGTPGCLIPGPDWLHPGLAVADLIYQPRETALLRMARQAGCRSFNGMGMLLYQGAAAFRVWTGREMPVDAVREAFFQDIGGEKL